MFWQTPDRRALSETSRLVGLTEIASGQDFRHRLIVLADMPEWLAHGDRHGQGGRFLIPDAILRVPDGEWAGRRPPSDVGVFEGPAGEVVCVADLHHGGFGLDRYVGPEGFRFHYAYSVSAITLAVMATASIQILRRCVTNAGDFILVVTDRKDLMARRVILRVRPDGKVEAEVDGVVGPACREMLDSLSQALGGAVVSTSEKPEMHMRAEEIPMPVGTGPQ